MTKRISAVRLSDLDNCVTLTGNAEPGDDVFFPESGSIVSVTARGNIPIWHKMAIKQVAAGSGVFKYGALIGAAVCDIDTGDHIHTHNITSPTQKSQL